MILFDFQISKPVMFLDTFIITLTVSINDAKLPHTGKVFITTPIYLTYTNRKAAQFTLVKALTTSVDVPVQPLPTVTPVAGKSLDKFTKNWFFIRAVYSFVVISLALPKAVDAEECRSNLKTQNEDHIPLEGGLGSSRWRTKYCTVAMGTSPWTTKSSPPWVLNLSLSSWYLKYVCVSSTVFR